MHPRTRSGRASAPVGQPGHCRARHRRRGLWRLDGDPGGDDPGSAEAPTTAHPPDTSAAPSLEAGSIKLGIAYWDTRTYAFQLMLKGAEAVAAADPAIDLAAAAPDAGDPAKLLPMFQAMAQTQTDGIVLQALAADPFYRPVKETVDCGHARDRDRRPAACRCRRRAVHHQ